MLNILFYIFIKSSSSWFAYFSSQGDWKPAKHLLLIEKLIIYAQNQGKKLIINLPPRHGKSEFISKYYPAYLLTFNFNSRIMLSSYNTSFATHWGAEVKQILENFSNKFIKISISKNIKSKGNFRIKGKKGGMYCIGANGSITGRGADILIIDDPIKNDKDAMSNRSRENVLRWFNSTAFTRIEPNGIIILMMTRWHEDDLAGRLIKDYADKIENSQFQSLNKNWLWLNLPAIAEENDPLSRNFGEALWKERFNFDKLNEIKVQIGDYWFSALYQQRPSPAIGNIFKRESFKYFESDQVSFSLFSDNGVKKIIDANYISKFATIDLATSLNQRADYTVVIVFGLTPEREILILDIIRERFSSENHLQLIESIYNKWNPSSIGIEKVQYQISLIENARAKGFPIVSLIPDKDKLQRALPMVHQLKEGKVYFKKNAHWLDIFERELLNFPNSEHDDQVDAFAYILQMIKPITNILPSSRKKRSILDEIEF